MTRIKGRLIEIIVATLLVAALGMANASVAHAAPVSPTGPIPTQMKY